MGILPHRLQTPSHQIIIRPVSVCLSPAHAAGALRSPHHWPTFCMLLPQDCHGRLCRASQHEMSSDVWGNIGAYLSLCGSAGGRSGLLWRARHARGFLH